MIERLALAMGRPLQATLADLWIRDCAQRLLALVGGSMSREQAEDLACDLYLSPAGYRELDPAAAADRAFAWWRPEPSAPERAR